MDDHREGILADKPIPPWERPGCFRLDCEPHRGKLLWWLGFAGFLAGFLAWIPVCGVVPGLVGIFINLYGRRQVKADLAKMNAGRMDPTGRADTATAKDFSNAGLLFSIIGAVIWGAMILITSWRDVAHSL